MLRENATPEKKEQEKASDKRRKEIIWEKSTPAKKVQENVEAQKRVENLRENATSENSYDRLTMYKLFCRGNSFYCKFQSSKL